MHCQREHVNNKYSATLTHTHTACAGDTYVNEIAATVDGVMALMRKGAYVPLPPPPAPDCASLLTRGVAVHDV